MNATLRKYIIILPFLVFTSYYLVINFHKFKGALVNWYIMFKAPKENFPLRVSCRSSEEGRDFVVNRVFLDPLQLNSEGKLVFWLRADQLSESCNLNHMSIPVGICKIHKTEFRCLTNGNIVIYFWQNDADYTVLLKFFSGFPRLVNSFH